MRQLSISLLFSLSLWHWLFVLLQFSSLAICSLIPIQIQTQTQARRALTDNPPTITLDQATVTGVNQGNLSKFLGIPYAEAPIGPLRFRHPIPLTSYNGSINASSYGNSCPQQKATFPVSLSNFFDFTIPLPIIHNHTSSSSNSSTNTTNGDMEDDDPPENEDCLTINVIRPASVSTNGEGVEKLPVVVWIFGGGFERGNAQEYDEQATRIVNRSIELGRPVIYAAMNYRVSAWGFLASQEVLDEGVANAGLIDQRVALQWVNKYIGLFGGDNTRVTVWGQSAGAISTALQMMAYDGSGAMYVNGSNTSTTNGNSTNGNSTALFQGAFMQSGVQIPVGNVTGGQIWYDQVVNATGCSGNGNGNGNGTSTLDCLRQVPYEQFKVAVDMTPSYFNYTALSLAWSPRADGTFLTDNPQRLAQQRKVMNIPIVSGNVDDEGTLFSLSSRNVTTDSEFQSYISTVFVPGASNDELAPLWGYYPQDPANGSPFNTSSFNDITPQYKRIAAFQGDAVFQAQRRFLLESLVGQQDRKGIWSYLSRRDKYIPVVGSYHGSDLSLHLLDDYLIAFVYTYNPNLNSSSSSSIFTSASSNSSGDFPTWPLYMTDNPHLYTFPIFGDPEITNDTYREAPMQYLMNLSLAHPL